MKKLACGSVLLMAWLAAPAFACDDAPPVGKLPDGKTATIEEMRAAQGKVRAYAEGMEAYLGCLQDALDSKTDAPAEFKELMGNRIRSGDAEREQVLAAFNEQVQAYRAKPAN